MEEQLDPEQLESHRKYQQRKQNQTHTCIYTQVLTNTNIPFEQTYWHGMNTVKYYF